MKWWKKNVLSQFVSNVQGNQERATNIILNNELLLLRLLDNILRAAVFCIQIRIHIRIQINRALAPDPGRPKWSPKQKQKKC